MASDVLASIVTKPSTAIILIMQKKRVLVFYKDGFKLSAPFRVEHLQEIHI